MSVMGLGILIHLWKRDEDSSDGSNYVRNSMFDRSKPKIGCSSSINIT